MSRLRATLSSTPLDREIQTHVAEAERALQQALQRCMLALGDPKINRQHVSRVRRDIEKSLSTLRSVRRINPTYDMSDPDLVTAADSVE